MNITCISDLHNEWEKVNISQCDILIIAGDMGLINIQQMNSFLEWLHKIDAKYKIIIPGNHDLLLEEGGFHFFEDSLKDNEYILINQKLVLEDIKFWGSPYTPEFMNWAFMLPDNELSRYWDLIPDDTDILINVLQKISNRF